LALVSGAVGTVAAPVLVDLIDVRAALTIVGLLPPIAAAAAWRTLAAIDRESEPPPALEHLRRIGFLAALDEPALAQPAAAARPVDLAAGTEVVREGDVGDRFYVVAEGELRAGTGTNIGPGDGFGEIALLRDVPRTTSVTTVTDAELYAIERDAF